MLARGLLICIALGMVIVVSASAVAEARRVVVTSNTTHGDRTLHQDFNIARGWIDYHIVARDPNGLYPYCVTVRLERKRKRRGWRPLPKNPQTFRHQCFKTPADGESRRKSFAAWDTIIYPRRRIERRFRRGELRVRGSTDLGGKLIYRR